MSERFAYSIGDIEIGCAAHVCTDVSNSFIAVSVEIYRIAGGRCYSSAGQYPWRMGSFAASVCFIVVIAARGINDALRRTYYLDDEIKGYITGCGWFSVSPLITDSARVSAMEYIDSLG